MGRKKKSEPVRVMVSRRFDRLLWERFQHFCEWHVPRTTDTEMLERAMLEYLAKHEKKKGE